VGAGGVRPERDPPGRAEVLHESARTRVARLFVDGRAIIRKQPLGPDAPQRLRHELTILQRLLGVAGVAQLLEAPRFPGSIVTDDVDGTSLVGLADSLGTGIACVIFFVIYQQVENYLIYPTVMRRSVKVSDVAAVVAALLGVALFGVVGALVAIPMVAAVQLIIREVVVPSQEAR